MVIMLVSQPSEPYGFSDLYEPSTEFLVSTVFALFVSICIFLGPLLLSLFYNPAIDLKQMIWTRAEKRRCACCIYRFTHTKSRQDSHVVL